MAEDMLQFFVVVSALGVEVGAALHALLKGLQFFVVVSGSEDPEARDDSVKAAI